MAGSARTMKLTVKVKLLPTSEEKQSLLKTMERFNDACDYISKVAFENKLFGQVALHQLIYREVRERFGLSSQFTIRAIDKVSESYRANKKTLHTLRHD
jgi:putative transposase